MPYTTLDSYTAFFEQRASTNFPDILRNFVRMRRQWFPGRFFYGLGTRLQGAVRHLSGAQFLWNAQRLLEGNAKLADAAYSSINSWNGSV